MPSARRPYARCLRHNPNAALIPGDLTDKVRHNETPSIYTEASFKRASTAALCSASPPVGNTGNPTLWEGC